jgi:Zn-dependent peptidase ImmA (M78 family)
MAVADHPEVDVVLIPGLPVRGLYFPELQAICIRSGLTQSGRRCVLAHELAHHVLGHQPHPDRLERGRMEVRAARWAACRLISLEELAAAVRGALSWGEVAETLDVDEPTLRCRIGYLTDQERQRLGL